MQLSDSLDFIIPHTWLRDSKHSKMEMALSPTIEDEFRFLDSSLVGATGVEKDSKRESSKEWGYFSRTNVATLVHVCYLLSIFMPKQN